MELYQLRSFAAVAELGHLTRAADRLHVSQPALSAQIKALEDELGVPLFDRGPTGMTLTPAGKRLLPDALKVIADTEALRGAAASIKGAVAGRARVGTLSDPDFIRLPEFLSASIERFPLIEIELHHEVTGAAFAEVRDGAARRELLLRRPRPPDGGRGAAGRGRLRGRRAGRLARPDRGRRLGSHRRAAVDRRAGDQHPPRSGRGAVRRARIGADPS